MNDKDALYRHKLLGEITVIKYAISIILEGHAGELSEKSKELLEKSQERVEKLIAIIAEMKEEASYAKNTVS